jgi:hypothetical protein
MLGIIAKLKNMVADFVEAILLIESHCPGVVLPDAKPNLIRVPSHRSSKDLAHKRLSDTFAVPSLIYIEAPDFGWPNRQYARRRSSPSELGISNEFDAVVAYERLDFRIGDFRCLNGLAISVRTISVHVFARVEGVEGRAEGAFRKSRQACCVCRFCSSSGGHGSLLMDA